MKVVAAAAVIVLITAGSIAGSYLLGLHSLHQSQAQWCTTLTLLTSKPVTRPADPAANPSRENVWLFYEHLRDLERDFGC